MNTRKKHKRWVNLGVQFVPNINTKITLTIAIVVSNLNTRKHIKTSLSWRPISRVWSNIRHAIFNWHPQVASHTTMPYREVCDLDHERYFPYYLTNRAQNWSELLVIIEPNCGEKRTWPRGIPHMCVIKLACYCALSRLTSPNLPFEIMGYNTREPNWWEL